MSDYSYLCIELGKLNEKGKRRDGSSMYSGEISASN